MFNNKLSDDKFTKLIDALEENTRVHRKLLSKREDILPKVYYTDDFANAIGIKPASLRCYIWLAKSGDKSKRKYLPSGYKGVRPYWLKEQVQMLLGMKVFRMTYKDAQKVNYDDALYQLSPEPQKLMK